MDEAKYRKRPVVIEAVQWWPPGDPRHDPKMLTHRKGNAVTPGDYRQSGDLYQFSTIKGMGDVIFLIRTGGPNDRAAATTWPTGAPTPRAHRPRTQGTRRDSWSASRSGPSPLVSTRSDGKHLAIDAALGHVFEKGFAFFTGNEAVAVAQAD